MTGPEHYQIAERMIAREDAHKSYVTAIAQVHATLALAAATALSCYGETEPEAWQEVAGVQP